MEKNLALVTFITLFIIWVVRYNNLKKKYDALVACIYEKTKIHTSEGLKRSEDVKEGDLILQPNKSFSKVKTIIKTLILEEHLNEAVKKSSRMYAFKNTVITFWHKILLDDKMVLPQDHPEFVEDEKYKNIYVYNFLLENYEDKIITEDDVILESLMPYFDEDGKEHKPWISSA